MLKYTMSAIRPSHPSWTALCQEIKKLVFFRKCFYHLRAETSEPRCANPNFYRFCTATPVFMGCAHSSHFFICLRACSHENVLFTWFCRTQKKTHRNDDGLTRRGPAKQNGWGKYSSIFFILVQRTSFRRSWRSVRRRDFTAASVMI